MSAPNSRPVHPCVMNVWEGNAGAEYSTWARIVPKRRSSTGDSSRTSRLPDLVTAQGSTLTVYTMEETTGKLLINRRYPNLAGNVCFMETLQSPSEKGSDVLLLGFSGHPRLAIVTVRPDLLLATSLLDLTAALQENSYGAITPLEQDLQASLFQSSSNMATLSVILGGGVAVACLQLSYDARASSSESSSSHHDNDKAVVEEIHNSGGWTSAEPYVLPLPSLRPISTTGSGSNSDSRGNSNSNTSPATIMTGFGDILSVCFLPGYSEPTMVLLHSNPHNGQTWSGRLGRSEGSTRNALILTAMTVTVTHERSAVLWSTEVPADALHVYATGKQGCLVHCVNTVVAINNTGQVQQTLAANGWAKTTTPQSLVPPTTNPWPFPQLSIALDGAEFSFANDRIAFVILRSGQAYLLQYTNVWSFLPLFVTVGAIGQVANVKCCPLGKIIPAAFDSKVRVDTKTKNGVTIGKKSGDNDPCEMGLLFVGSRLGDSSVLGYALEKTSVADAIKSELGLQIKSKVEGDMTKLSENATIDENHEQILQLEEDALYAVSNGEEDFPDVIPPSDDDETENVDDFSRNSRRKRARLSELTVIRSLKVLDSLTALGPLGPACIGPLSQGKSEVSATTGTPEPALGSTGYIYPCGYGSSGGLALLTLPGRDDRTILAEEDCINAKAVFNLPTRGLVLLSMADRIRFLKLEKSLGSNESGLVEVDMTSWTSKELRSLFKSCELLAACERNEDSFILLISMKVDENVATYSLLVVNDKSGELAVETNIPLPVPEGESIRSVAPITRQEPGRVVMGYTLSTGEAKLVTLEDDGSVQGFTFEAQVPMDMDEQAVTAEEKYYAWGTVVSVDIFKAPRVYFEKTRCIIDSRTNTTKTQVADASTSTEDVDYEFDDEDKELYAMVDNNRTEENVQQQPEQVNLDDELWFVALARQSGKLEVYSLDDLTPGHEAVPAWTCSGCSHGVPQLSSIPRSSSPYRVPKQHKVQTSEIRFFFCGPSLLKSESSIACSRVFCVAIETSDGDAMLYAAELESRDFSVRSFRRVQLKSPGRPSKEQSKHFSKLRRKGIVKQAGDDLIGGFRHNRLFRFNRMSGQDGLFAATSRPLWFVAERGYPSMLYHRCRHAAPAGARPRPVAGFCSNVMSERGDNGFITLHERVGRVGSQRITVFDGILNFASTHGLIPGGGLFIEKIPMGVTVRSIQFIDNSFVCGARPLYAVLIAREIDEDLSGLNDDGMTQEERQRLAEEKENAKIKRQVEADLGGFDIEQEWVEEIERENCFKVDAKLGGAPPIVRSAYSLWIVDAASGWVVVDSYEFDESEHGLTMKVMSLSEFKAEPGSSTTDEIAEDELNTRMFITVGTGIVDKDAEDVSAKGRVVLLELTKSSMSAGVDLNFVYEKKIFHGPVNSLSCLSCEGKNRLIIGAGADVNVEQWGNDKLTQVGFFRATMHILDIKLFKNFFVLSDAYDSLYFLVWRESDKSLTLLAKDYDPIPVYSTGLLSRGGSLDLVCHDDRQNLQFFQYAPGDAAARGGNKLVCRADFHLGSQTIDLQSHFCRSSLLVNSATPASTIAALQQQDAFFGRTDDDQRLGVHFGTTDGEYGAIVPLSEPVYWRLTALQSVMVNALESDCALSQRAWRLYRRTPRRGGCRSNDRKKGVIDGNLIIQYADLAVADQEDLASAIGSTVDLILDNLLELRCSVMII